MFTDRTQFHSLACVSLCARASAQPKRKNVSTLTSRSPGTCQNGPGPPSASAFLYLGSKVKRITLRAEGGPGDEATTFHGVCACKCSHAWGPHQGCLFNRKSPGILYTVHHARQTHYIIIRVLYRIFCRGGRGR